MTADCLPVLLCDEAGTVVAAAHAGWRGLCQGVLGATVIAMHTPPEKLMAWLGPAIGAHVFEVGNEVRSAFIAQDEQAAQAFTAAPNNKWLMNIYQLARQRLKVAGIAHVYGGNFCTYTDKSRFFLPPRWPNRPHGQHDLAEFKVIDVVAFGASAAE